MLRNLPSSRLTIGLLGGSFNPAHEGHLHISLWAMRQLQLDEVWWLVSPQNPLKSKKDMASFARRFDSATHWAQHPRVKVSDAEVQLGTQYTADTIKKLQQRYPNVRFVWLMGADNWRQFHRWNGWRQIAATVPIAIAERTPDVLACQWAPAALSLRGRRRTSKSLVGSDLPAWTVLTLPRHPVSATELRKKLGKEAFLRHNKVK